MDEFGSGFPSAYCISNRIDAVQMEIFFNAVKDKTSVISTNIFMSDDTPSYYNAWEKVMGAAQKRLLCTWHIDKNWRQALSKVNSFEKKTISLQVPKNTDGGNGQGKIQPVNA